MKFQKIFKLVCPSLLAMILVGCESTETVDRQIWTHQPLENAKYLKVGMTENEVVQIMGEPVTREFQGKRSALQWCSTGAIGTNNPYDRFLLAVFTDEKLTEIKNFSNKNEFEQITEQVKQQGGIDCASLIQNVHWLEQADKIIEVRERNMNQYY